MSMYATVVQAQASSLLVIDRSTSQQVFVHTTNGNRFSAGQCVCICYNGVMTLSIPPQITATSITRARCY